MSYNGTQIDNNVRTFVEKKLRFEPYKDREFNLLTCLSHNKSRQDNIQEITNTLKIRFSENVYNMEMLRNVIKDISGCNSQKIEDDKGAAYTLDDFYKIYYGIDVVQLIRERIDEIQKDAHEQQLIWNNQINYRMELENARKAEQCLPSLSNNGRPKIDNNPDIAPIYQTRQRYPLYPRQRIVSESWRIKDERARYLEIQDRLDKFTQYPNKEQESSITTTVSQSTVNKTQNDARVSQTERHLPPLRSNDSVDASRPTPSSLQSQYASSFQLGNNLLNISTYKKHESQCVSRLQLGDNLLYRSTYRKY
ncbi:MAG: hypothetical protein LBC92_03030 [Rickettsiales bacterium]|jgi:hypothetical protein|nr:hypothetical protein [Rickettsiales bacterium]